MLTTAGAERDAHEWAVLAVQASAQELRAQQQNDESRTREYGFLPGNGTPGWSRAAAIEIRCGCTESVGRGNAKSENR